MSMSLDEVIAEIEEIRDILSYVRSSLDVASYPAWMTEHHHAIVREAYLTFEEVRFNFNKSTSDFKSRSIPEYVWALEQLHKGLIQLSARRNFIELAGTARYKRTQSHRASRSLHYRLYQSGGSVGDAIANLISSISGLLYPTGGPRPVDRPGNALKEVVPKEHTTSPLRFDIIGGRLVIIPHSSTILDDDIENLKLARDELISTGQDLLDKLGSSNADPRLVETVKYVQDKLENEGDVVRLGLATVACEIMIDSFVDELSPALSGLTKSHVLKLNMYIAQFPAWRRFTEQAASIKLTQEDVRSISSAAADIASRLKASPEIADPEVPRTLEALRALIDDPRRATKKAVFAVWRSIENLIIKVFNFGADLLDQSARKAVDKVSTAVGRGAAIALMTVALAGAVALSPLATRVPESAWITKAVEIVQSQLGI